MSAIDNKKPYITISSGMSGWFAVMLWYAPQHGGFWEPWETGFGRWETRDEAIEEGRDWAEAEEMEFII